MRNERQPTYTGIDELRGRFEIWKDPIRKRLLDFAVVPAGEYFYELIYCLLTPQSSAINAGRAVEQLKQAEQGGETVDPVQVLADPAHYIRFHNTKAKWVLEARRRFPVIARELSNRSTSHELREWLVNNVEGLGWKEASHFLRNIGHQNLAILDRHILKNLKRHAVLRRLPKTLTKRRYLQIEQKYRLFAGVTGISMDELDLLFWSSETGKILK
jgi:N-glycosylase/DNA lyase